MLEELLLHVGPPKTGTTGIQAALAASAADLRRAGIYMPLASGGEPGRHLPILREVVGDDRYQREYALSQDTLSLEETMAGLVHAGCDRLLLSSEQFLAPGTQGDVLALLNLLAPTRVAIVHAIRPTVPWMLSMFAQHLTYGLTAESTWTVDRFAESFVADFLKMPADSYSAWGRGAWVTSLRTIFLPSGHADVLGLFSAAADIPVVLQGGHAANQRRDVCSLFTLQALNLIAFDQESPLSERVAGREQVLKSLRQRGVPSHDCSCQTRLTQETVDFLLEGQRRHVRWALDVSTASCGNPIIAGPSESERAHSAFPGKGGLDVVVRVLASALVDNVDLGRQYMEARDFWHHQAGRQEEAAAYWRTCAEASARPRRGWWGRR